MCAIGARAHISLMTRLFKISNYVDYPVHRDTVINSKNRKTKDLVDISISQALPYKTIIQVKSTFTAVLTVLVVSYFDLKSFHQNFLSGGYGQTKNLKIVCIEQIDVFHEILVLLEKFYENYFGI